MPSPLEQIHSAEQGHRAHYVLLALDPGNVMTGWALWRAEDRDLPSFHGDHANAEVADLIEELRFGGRLAQIACEFPVARPGGSEKDELFATCREVGLFQSIATRRHGWNYTGASEPSPVPFYLADRADVKKHLCRKTAAKDKDVREAILKRFGGKEVALAKGKAAKAATKKKSAVDAVPAGPLVGVVGDTWQALAVGLCWRDQALPDEAERARRKVASAQAKAANAAKKAQRLVDKANVSAHAATL